MARQSVSICMLLQSGILSVKKSQNNDLFSVFRHSVVVRFTKTIVLYFLQDSALTWYWEGGAGACSMGRRCEILILFLFLIECNILCMLWFVKYVSCNIKGKN